MLHAIERRSEARRTAGFGVATSWSGDDEAYLGKTRDVSPGGMCVAMDCEPPAEHLDATLANSRHWARVLVHVVDHSRADRGFIWHLRVTHADSRWHRLNRAVSSR